MLGCPAPLYVRIKPHFLNYVFKTAVYFRLRELTDLSAMISARLCNHACPALDYITMTGTFGSFAFLDIKRQAHVVMCIYFEDP